MRYKTNEGEGGEILQGEDGLWMHPDDPARDPLQLHGADGRPLDSEPRRYSATTPEFCEEFLAKASALEEECIEARCEEMGLTPGHLRIGAWRPNPRRSTSRHPNTAASKRP